MRIILADDVVGVGDIGDTVTVKPGYARNFLIPRGFAIEAQSASAKEIKHKMRHIEAKKSRLKDGAQAVSEKLTKAQVTLKLRVGTGGKVFGSVGTRDIASKLKELGFDVDRRRVMLSDPIRTLGSHEVGVKLHPEVISIVRVNVESMEATKDQEQLETDAARAAIEAAAEARDEELADEREAMEALEGEG
jgi:large subunit ribosomal protein L9